MKRINSIDFTRGLVMIIMALDHVRDLIHVTALTQNPTDLTTTTPLMFFTRWITHLCAPTFVFLSGTSAWLSMNRKNNLSDSRKFLLKRGLWLILLDVTVVNFMIFFDTGFHTTVFEVIGAFGFGFILLSFLSRLSSGTVGFIGLAIILLHNLFPMLPFGEGSVLKSVLSPFFAMTAFPLGAGRMGVIGYPPIPWLGIMLAGFGAGRFFLLDLPVRKKLFLKIGIGAILGFVLIRYINIYGDPALWSPQKNAAFTFMSFFNVTKYPPSLLFCLITLGIMFLFLAFAEGFSGKLNDFVRVYGSVPLFYFIVHFFLIHIILLIVLLLQGFEWSQFEFASGSYGRPRNVQTGLSLAGVYPLWISVVLLMYWPCRWYSQYKSTHDHWWLRYV